MWCYDVQYDYYELTVLIKNKGNCLQNVQSIYTQSVQAVRGEQNDHKRVNAGKQQPGAKKSLYAKKRGIRSNYFKTGPEIQDISKNTEVQFSEKCGYFENTSDIYLKPQHIEVKLLNTKEGDMSQCD